MTNTGQLDGQATSTISSLINGYNEVMANKRDPRLDGWLLMSSPWPTLTICLSYVLLVKVAGPRFMRNREPYDLRNLLVLYNGLQVIFSAWLFYEYGRGGWFHNYSFTCQPVDYSRGEMAMRMVHACWWYYFSKYTEFFDTFFFILRKKMEHVSILHVIHHGCMPMSVWFGLRFTPGGHSTFFGLLNTFVHIIMYFYYMMAAMGPRYARFIWWKKYLTSIQMVQFVAISVHAFQLFFTDCDYPKAFVWWIGLHGVLFLFLFSNFYKKSYALKQKQLAEKQANGKTSNGKAINGMNGKSPPSTSYLAMKTFSDMNGGTTHSNSNQLVDSNSNGIKLKPY